jgi:hypothetical protein
MIREFFSHQSDAPHPKAVLAVVVWIIALVCLFAGTRRGYGWLMIGVATVNTMQVAWAFRQYYGRRKPQ